MCRSEKHLGYNLSFEGEVCVRGALTVVNVLGQGVRVRLSEGRGVQLKKALSLIILYAPVFTSGSSIL